MKDPRGDLQTQGDVHDYDAEKHQERARPKGDRNGGGQHRQGEERKQTIPPMGCDSTFPTESPKAVPCRVRKTGEEVLGLEPCFFLLTKVLDEALESVQSFPGGCISQLVIENLLPDRTSSSVDFREDQIEVEVVPGAVIQECRSGLTLGLPTMVLRDGREIAPAVEGFAPLVSKTLSGVLALPKQVRSNGHAEYDQQENREIHDWISTPETGWTWNLVVPVGTSHSRSSFARFAFGGRHWA